MIESAEAKSVITGVAAYYMLNRFRWGAAAAVASYTLSKTIGHNETPWLTRPEWRPWMTKWATVLPLRVALGALLLKVGLGANKQTAAIMIQRGLKMGGRAALKVVTLACIKAPLIEEVIFRGALLEKIGDVQTWCGQKPEDGKALRLAITSILFGFAHFRASQGWQNLVIVGGTGFMGYLFGAIKEHEGLIYSIGLHSAMNGTATLALWLTC